jgi:hypothetical protein
VPLLICSASYPENRSVLFTQQIFLATIWMNYLILLMMQDILPIQWKVWKS